LNFLKSIINLIRVKQWIKNLFIFAPLIFSNSFFNSIKIESAGWTFLLFSLAASSVYVVNDLSDLNLDRNHPIKKFKRPLANGSISTNQAKLILFFLYFLILIVIYSKQLLAGYVIALYILINFLYSKWLKNFPIIDLTIVASGFVFRVLAGSIAIAVQLSSWMFITTFSLALFLASIKRRQELIIFNKSNSQDLTRTVLNHYSVPLLDKVALISCISTLLYYSMFVFTSRMELIFTIPIVMFGVFRYWYLVEIIGEGESPTDLFYKDSQIFIITSIWACFSIFNILKNN
jgi:decaprenyl-phosphate phosphoribosyltransferase